MLTFAGDDLGLSESARVQRLFVAFEDAEAFHCEDSDEEEIQINTAQEIAVGVNRS